MHRLPLLPALLLALALPALVIAADAELELAAELGTGIDTNPQRLAGDGGPAGGFGAAQVRARAKVLTERLRLDARIAQAGRLYPGTSDATASATRADIAARLPLSERLSVGASLVASDLTERGHRLDEDGVEGGASLAWAAGGFGASLSAGWNAFLPRALLPREAPLRAFRASGPEGSLRASWAPAQEHLFSAGYGLWAASYPRWRDVAPAGRDDVTQTVSAEYAHRGALLAGVGYAYSWNRSTALGGDFERHRLTARCAAFLPYDFTVAGRGALQWSHYPDPLFRAQDLLLAQGQESLNALEVRLTHPLSGPLEMAVAIAWYGGDLAQGAGVAPGFSRGVVSTTIGWRGAWRR